MIDGPFFKCRCILPIPFAPELPVIDQSTSTLSLSGRSFSAEIRGWPSFLQADCYRGETTVALLFGWADTSDRARLHAKDFAQRLNRSRECLEDLLHKSGGSFILLLFRGASLYLATDRFGSIPLYFRSSGRGSAYSTRVSDLLTGDDALDSIAAVSLIKYGCPHGSRTLVADISVVSPAALISFSDKPEVTTYWKWSIENPRRIERNDLSLLAEAFQEGLARGRDCAGGDSGLAVGLSGGLDTRLLVGLLSRHIGTDFCGYTFYGDDRAGDLTAAVILAKHLGINHTRLKLEVEDFLEASPQILDANNGILLTASFLFWTLAKAVQKDGKRIVITPSAEIFFGSRIKAPIFKQTPKQYLLENEPQITGYLNYIAPDLLRKFNIEEPVSIKLDEYAHDAAKDRVDAHVKWDLANRQRRMIFPNVAGTMSSTVDVLEVHWTSVVRDLLLQIPARERLNRTFQRTLICHVDAGLAKLPEAKDGLPIAHKARYRYTRAILRRMGPQGQRYLHASERFCEFEGAYHFFRKWWCEQPGALQLRQVVESVNWVDAGLLTSNDFGQFYEDSKVDNRAGEESSLLLYSLYTLAIAIRHWKLSI